MDNAFVPAPAAAAGGATAAGCYQLQAPLTFATVPALRPQGLRLLQEGGGELSFDLQQIGQADSAGLALLIDWLAQARRSGRMLHYVRAPDGLLALARLSEVEPLLKGGPPPG